MNILDILQFTQGDIPVESIVPIQEEVLLDSSWVDSGIYDPTTQTMEVTLLGGDTYLYFNVSPIMAERFFDATSPGTFINKVFKKGYFPYSRLN